MLPPRRRRSSGWRRSTNPEASWVLANVPVCDTLTPMQEAAHGYSAIHSVREDEFMFAGRFPIEAIFVRLVEAYLAPIILDSAEQGVTLGGVLAAILVVAIIEAGLSPRRAGGAAAHVQAGP
jgi:hypothetical protein